MNYDERQKFEHELIDRKLNWMLTSQTILFAALALIFEGRWHGQTISYNCSVLAGPCHISFDGNWRSFRSTW